MDNDGTTANTSKHASIVAGDMSVTFPLLVVDAGGGAELDELGTAEVTY